MPVQDHLRKTVDSLANRLRDEFARELAAAVGEAQAEADSERETAVARATVEARTAADQAAAARLAVELGSAEERARAAGRAEGFSAGRTEGVDEGRAAGRAEGLAQGRQDGLADGRERGLSEGREQGLKDGHDRGVAEGREQGLEEGRERGLAEGREQGSADGHQRGLAEGRDQGLADGLAEGRMQGLAEGREEGLAEGREEGLTDGREEGLTEGWKIGHAEGLVEGHAHGLVEGREDGLAEGREQGLVDGRALGLVAGREEVATDPSTEADLADAFRAIDAARSLSEILDALTVSAGRNAARAALVLVRGTELRTWRSVGLGTADTFPQHIESAGIVRDAVRTLSTASAGATSDGSRLAEDTLAVPVIVGGEVVAVVYADQEARDFDSPQTPARSWRTTIELMTRYAARSLEAVTAFRTAQLFVGGDASRGSGASASRAFDRTGPVDRSGSFGDGDEAARRYARLLVLELKMYHAEAVAAGRRERDLANRLGGEIERARILYERRVPASVRAQSNYFDDELVRTLAAGDGSLLSVDR